MSRGVDVLLGWGDEPTVSAASTPPGIVARAPGECAYEAFAREEAKRPPWLRSAGAMLVCRCPKCAGRVIA